MSDADWPFEGPPNVAVLTVRSVLDGAAPICFITHDAEDGGWQFLDGNAVSEADARVVALSRIWRLDSTIAELSDLPMGWQATRQAPGRPWQRRPSRE